MNEIFPNFLPNNEFLATQTICMAIIWLIPNVKVADIQPILQCFEYESTEIWDRQSGEEKHYVFCTYVIMLIDI
jgi:hypothetical protein